MFTIQFRCPYSQQLVQQSFPTLEKAQSMIKFYATCGTAAKMI